MLKVATAEEMQRIDRITINKYGIAGTVLMERAGLAVVRRIKERYFTDGAGLSTIIILCGGGNNGGDGLVIARVLHNQGRDVRVYLSAKPADLKGDGKVNYHAAKKFGVSIYPIKNFLSGNVSPLIRRSIIVDALLGTGLSKEVRSPLPDVIKKVNRTASPVISVDIPSGISSDSGQVMGSAVKADSTVTFGLPKRGHLLYPGAEYAGELFVEDIGFPKDLLRSRTIRTNLVQEPDIRPLLPARPRHSHKGTYGHVLLVAGSRGKTGAALMAARACLRTGAGLVTIGVPRTLVNSFQSRVTEEMLLPLPDKDDGTLSSDAAEPVLDFLRGRGTVLAIGPGMSCDTGISRLVRVLVTAVKVSMVIDADGLNAMSGITSLLRKSRAEIIMTPHPGEMARLLVREKDIKVRGDAAGLRNEIDEERIERALSFAKRTGTYLVLKGVPTVTATPAGDAFVNMTGNPGMAKAGTGDVLTGMIASLLAQGLNPLDASVAGVYMHGHIGDVMAKKRGTRSLIASDMISAIPSVFKSILRN
jgi:NAD(P)H-hydrate epimerase